MVNSKRYNPSNKRFQKHTQSFVEGKTMKGHLVDGEKKGDKYKTTGELVKVNKNDLSGTGWYVKVEKKTLKCNYGDNIYYLPPYTEQGDWYFPKSKCEVEVSVDERSKIFTITKIKDSRRQPFAMYSDGVRLEGSGASAVQVAKDVVNVLGKQMEVQNDIKIDTSETEGLPDSIRITDMYKEIQDLKNKIGDNNVNRK